MSSLRPDEPFRPRRGRAVPLVVAGVFLALCVVVGVGLVRAGVWRAVDLLLLVGLGVAIGAFLARYAGIRAVPTEAGLVVRNLFLSRTVPWGEVVAVRFPDGDPWVTLDLADDEELAVMAIQRADAELGRAEAQRLADLVAARQRGLPG